MTNDDFDPEMLRRLDGPRRPSPAASDSIRNAMLSAFDEEVEHADSANDPTAEPVDLDPVVTIDPAPPTAGRHLEVALDPEDPPASDRRSAEPRVRQSTWRVVRYAAIAAALAAAVAGIVALRAGEGAVELVPVDTTDSDIDNVRLFCLDDVDPLIDDMVAFVEQPGGELSDRGLRNAELLAQRYRDLADRLDGELAVAVTDGGDALLIQAADARREYSASGDDDVIRTLIDDAAAAIAALPGSGICRLADLQDSSS